MPRNTRENARRFKETDDVRRACSLCRYKPCLILGPAYIAAMSIDIASYLGTVTRVVHDRTRDGEPVKVVSAARTYETDIEDLWNAITTAERIARWFTPVTGELRLGGRYQLQGNAGGTVTACDQPRHLALTWEFMGAVSWVDVTLTARYGGVRL